MDLSEINGHDIMKLGIGVKDEHQIEQALNWYMIGYLWSPQMT